MTWMTWALAFAAGVGFAYALLPLREALANKRALGDRNGALRLVANTDIRRESFRASKLFLLSSLFLAPLLPIGDLPRGTVSGLAFIALTVLLVISVFWDRLDAHRLRSLP